ncbi:MAG TPA: hypothetical protein VK968_12375, partial [Roseimicrobium sp.]|nr:hypothetical protein [Roseimicrobium sp.]
PLGRSAGNWLEVREAARCLDGYGPDDLQLLSVECAAVLLVETGKAKDLAAGRQLAMVSLASGAAARKWDEMLASQGANPIEFRHQIRSESTAPVVVEYITPEEGFVTRCDARIIGEIVRDLGGGRMQREDIIDPSVGIDELAKPGEPFGVGSVLARVHAATKQDADAALVRLNGAFECSRDPYEASPLIVERI